jgi:hypothetical protein
MFGIDFLILSSQKAEHRLRIFGENHGIRSRQAGLPISMHGMGILLHWEQRADDREDGITRISH